MFVQSHRMALRIRWRHLLTVAVAAGVLVALVGFGYFDSSPSELAVLTVLVAVFAVGAVEGVGGTALYQVVFSLWFVGWGGWELWRGDGVVPWGLVLLGTFGAGYYTRIVVADGWDAPVGRRADGGAGGGSA